MSKILLEVEDESMIAVADMIRYKTAIATKFTVSEMPPAIGKLHGYHANAKQMASEIAQNPTTTFPLSTLTFTTNAAIVE